MTPDHWTEQTLANLVQSDRKITYGIVQPGGFVDDGVPLVRGGDYANGWVPLTEIKRVRPEIDAPYRRSKLRGGDLLMTIVGYTGAVAEVPQWLTGANITQTTARIAIDEAISDPRYCFHALQSSFVQNQVRRFTKGAAQPGLNLEDVELLIVPQPDRVEQRRIAAVLDTWDDAIISADKVISARRLQKQSLVERLLVAENSQQSAPLGHYFSERKQRGRDELPIYSITLDNGLVPRDTLDRRTETSLLNEAHALVEPGDIAYNMMRMWQGALGVCRQSCVVSPAYVVMKPKLNVDPRFAAAWMKSKRGLNRLWAYSHGLTEDRLRLYADDFLAIPVTFPLLDEQRHIASLLETAGETITNAENCSALLRRQRLGLMQMLLTGKWRVPARGDFIVPGGPLADQLSEAAE